MFKRISGKPKLEWFAKTASTALNYGALVAFTSGYLTQANATSVRHAGVLMRAVVATDEDYAQASKVPVDFPNPDDIFEVDVLTGTLTQAHVGVAVDLHASGLGIDVTATAVGAVTVVGVVSPSKALVKINSVFTSDE